MKKYRIIYNSLTKEIVNMLEAKGVSRFDLRKHSMIEDHPGLLLEKVINLNLDEPRVIAFLEEHEGSRVHDLLKVIKDKNFGREMLNEFLSENKNMPMTLEQDLQLLNDFSPIKSMLEIGAINRAFELWSQIIPDGIVISQDRYDKYIEKLTAYLSGQ